MQTERTCTECGTEVTDRDYELCPKCLRAYVRHELSELEVTVGPYAVEILKLAQELLAEPRKLSDETLTCAFAVTLEHASEALAAERVPALRLVGGGK